MADQGSASITIEAGPDAVMAVIADFPAYPQWARAVKRAEVVEAGEDGRARQVRLVIDAGLVRDDYVLAYDWDGDRQVSWHLVHGQVMKAQDGSYTLTALAEERTEVRYQLSVELGIPMPGILKRKAERVVMDTALKELKKRVEG
ncbi:MAG: SRPBCC family protein [Mycobacteriales bacterium]